MRQTDLNNYHRIERRNAFLLLAFGFLGMAICVVIGLSFLFVK